MPSTYVSRLAVGVMASCVVFAGCDLDATDGPRAEFQVKNDKRDEVVIVECAGEGKCGPENGARISPGESVDRVYFVDWDEPTRYDFYRRDKHLGCVSVKYHEPGRHEGFAVSEATSSCMREPVGD